MANSGPIAPFNWTMKDQPPLPDTYSTDTLLSPTTTILPSQQSHDIYINQGRDLFIQSLYHQEQLYSSLNGEKAELFARLYHTHSLRAVICSGLSSTLLRDVLLYGLDSRSRQPR